MSSNTKMRHPHRLITLDNPIISHDNKHVAVEIKTEDADPLDAEIPLSEIGTIVEFLVSIADYHQPDYKPKPLELGDNLSPIKIKELVLTSGTSPDDILLVVRLAGFDLAFSLSSEQIALFGLDFARTAQALAANHQKPPH